MLDDDNSVFQGYLVPHTDIDGFPTVWESHKFSYRVTILVHHLASLYGAIKQALRHADGRAVQGKADEAS
jgi:hypothetical protein